MLKIKKRVIFEKKKKWKEQFSVLRFSTDKKSVKNQVGRHLLKNQFRFDKSD